LYYSMGLVAGDLRSNVWTRVDESTGSNAIIPMAAHVHQILGDSRGGFWIASDAGLYFLDATNAVRSQWLHESPSVPAIPQPQMPPGMRLPAAFLPHRSSSEIESSLARILDL